MKHLCQMSCSSRPRKRWQRGGYRGPAPVSADRSEKSVRKCVRAGVSKRQVESSSGNNRHWNGKSRDDTTPCNGKGLSSTVIDFHQRARRDSNPQHPDRQAGSRPPRHPSLTLCQQSVLSPIRRSSAIPQFVYFTSFRTVYTASLTQV